MGKHYESVYTRFFQGYILPTKFKIDKRVGHLSDLIRSGQLSRENALKELSLEGYNADMKNIDIDFVMKKLDFDKESFEKMMIESPKNFMDYPNSSSAIIKIKKSSKFLREKGFIANSKINIPSRWKKLISQLSVVAE
jgi:hypothetical protein